MVLPRGIEQEFCARCIGIEPLKLVAMTNDVDHAYPVAICVSPNVGQNGGGAFCAQYTFLVLEITKEGAYSPKVVRQILASGDKMIGLYDVYGAKEGDDSKAAKQCVICMSASCDAMLLPCRHYIVCGRCASEIVSRTGKCPICRTSKTNKIEMVAITSTLSTSSGELIKFC